ncbi:MAG: hypothetical protein LAT64_05170 [Phycisphaerales bacterium]|nr:hypothetical protein [Planctomycetota bacterium]MCH8508147.1 hypothetical protein [Phycisphaerales bacterium]
MTTERDSILTFLVQAGLGALLVYAAWNKTGEIPMFALLLQQSVPGFGGLSTPTLFAAANVIVFVEVFIGMALIFFLFPRAMRWIAVGLFALFTAVLVLMFFGDASISCGCLGFSPSGWSGRAEIGFGIVRNLFMIAMLVVIARHARSGIRTHR